MSEISQYTESLHEECGVFGMYDKTGETDMVSAVYSALYALQHRGQESCGIALNVDGVLSGHRDLGLVSEVFTKRVLEDAAPRRQDGHRPRALRHRRASAAVPTRSRWFCITARAPWPSATTATWSTPPKLRRKLEMSGSIFHGTLGYRGHRLPADPEPPADAQH